MKILFAAGSLFIAIVFGTAMLFAQNENALPSVEIPGSHLRKMKSAIIDQEYNLYVHLPNDYHDTTKKYPVIYLLDAQWDFSLVTALYGQQYYDGFIPAAIIVGITWGGENPNYDSLRARDLSPTNMKYLPQSGGAEKFLLCIKNEIIPAIDSNYRTLKNDRTIMGSSFGGLFTLYAMLNGTELFQRYVATSPAIGWDNENIYLHENKYLDRHPKDTVRLFVAQGELEGGVPRFEKFMKLLVSRNYPGFSIRSKVLDNMGHSGGKAEGYTRGLQFVFERPSLILSSGALDQFVGKYSITDKNTITLSKKNGHLAALMPDNNIVELFAETETDFYAKGFFLSVHFGKNDPGKIQGLMLEQYAAKNFLKKIE